MSDIRFNQWLHQSGTGGVTQISSGHVGIGTTNPLIPVHSTNTATLNVGIITANNIYAGTLNGTLALSNISGITGSFTSDVTINGNLDIVDKIRHIGDTNTAIRFPAADTITAETNAVERLRIASDGKIGIGTVATHSFEIFSGADHQNIMMIKGTNAAGNYAGVGVFQGNVFITGGGIGSNSTGIVFRTAASGSETERLRITSDGKVGINRTSPARHLHAYAAGAGFVAKFEGSFSYSAVEFADSGTTNAPYIGSKNDHFTIATGGNNERLRITSTGKVGIGTDNPTTDLQVNHATNECTISLFNGGTKKAALQTQNSFGTILYSYDNEPLKFSVASGTSYSEKLRILSNGHVAIGDDIANDTGMFKVIAADGQSDDQYVGQFKNLEATTNRNWGLLIQAGSSSTDESLRVRNGANNADHLTIRGDGVVTKPKTPTFATQGSGDAISAQSPLPFDSILYNNGSHYNNSTYKFNVPVNGYYYVTCHVVPTGFANNTQNVELYIKDDQGNRFFLDRKVKTTNYASNNFSVGGSRILYKTAGADLWVEFNSISGSPTLESSSHFGIMLMA